MKKLQPPKSIEVRSSEVDGYGVFATEDILKHEVLEECYYLLMSHKWENVDPILKQYVFAYIEHDWFARLHTPGEQKPPTSSVAVLGYGMIYNHSEENNVSYSRDHDNKIFTYYTNREIKKGEELFIDYGRGSHAEMMCRVQ